MRWDRLRPRGRLGAIRPRFERLKHTLAITTLSSPAWVDRFVMRQPVKRVRKTALLSTWAPRCRFEMRSLYKTERLSALQVGPFMRRIDRALGRWA